MLMVPASDSLRVSLPYLGISIPEASFWALVGSLVTFAGTLTVAYFVYRLAKTQFRSNHWYQLQEKMYNAIVNELGTIRDASTKLARYDMPDVDPEDITVTYTTEEKAAFQDQIQKAQDVLRREIHRGVLLLSPRAIDAVQRYIWQSEVPISMDVDYPRAHAAGQARMAYAEFADIAQDDLGVPGLFWARRKAGIAALRERLARLWYCWTPGFNLQMMLDFKTSFRLWRHMWEGRVAPGVPPVPRRKRIMRWVKRNFLTIQK